ncbi:tripartite tricarboxylate transporter substrate binding protein [Sediminicoccus sp. KRV36]|uniref:tripartite tricarboxylate transporter substrate binding protein n=1 Tax=Sediminicoccus sp. KRV36 TaxID=3133721 RepID=UPI00200CF072|nr:tripartite tricarboxylate transporter substrate binding protein [Sediminicoccus rosea]UPY39251.1 tripartite tricarboxylate transporter substrate binding protein [Sediminicoccus rosea]
MIQRRSLLAAPALLAADGAMAQAAYPNRPVRVVIPWPPGQATDLAARVMAMRLTETLGQPFVAENRAGAGGLIGTDAVAKATPDGYTLLAASTGPIVTSPLVQRTPFNAERDFAPIAITGIAPLILVVPPNFPAQNAAEFIALLKANPGRYTFSSSGTGATAHIIASWFHALAGVEVVHVPFAGSAPALTAVMGGHVNYSIETVAAAGAAVRNGQLRALGISFKNGSSLAPGIPPLAALPGLSAFDGGAWIGLMAPAGTPAAIIERLDAEVARAMQLPEIRERVAASGLEPDYRGAAAMATYITTQRAAFAEAIRVANIRIEG